VAAHGRLTYTITVTNAGPGTAMGVRLLTNRPKRTKFVSATGATCTAVRAKRGGIRCDLGSIAPGDSRTVTIKVKVKGGRKPVTARSTVSSSTSDPNPLNNTDSETTAIVK
jgi:uncharacterized repeat protein (TIGR01451 family)